MIALCRAAFRKRLEPLLRAPSSQHPLPRAFHLEEVTLFMKCFPRNSSRRQRTDGCRDTLIQRKHPRPGLKSRLLSELQQLINACGWDAVKSYGSAQQHHDRILRERSANAPPPTNTNKLHQHPHSSSTEEPDSHSSPSISLSPTKKPLQDSLPHYQRVHDDIKDPITIKAERHTLASKEQREAIARGTVRGVETLGPWTGASLVVGTMQVKGVHEVEREEFLRHGMRDGGGLLY